MTDLNRDYFLSNTTFENDNSFADFFEKKNYKVVGFDLNYGDEMSGRCYLIKLLENQKKVKKGMKSGASIYVGGAGEVNNSQSE